MADRIAEHPILGVQEKGKPTVEQPILYGHTNGNCQMLMAMMMEKERSLSTA